MKRWMSARESSWACGPDPDLCVHITKRAPRIGRRSRIARLLVLEVRMAPPTDTAVERPSEYEKFQILVDDPADDPRLGFREYADAFADIVCGSPPRFAVGIFGSWGSGKTTLMRAIMAASRGGTTSSRSGSTPGATNASRS